MIAVCEGVDISGKTGRGRRIDAGDMVVDASMFYRVSDGLLE